MKKSIIALMGLFVLVACSDDSYQEADKMSENGSVENAELQNNIKTIDPSILYESPYGTTDRFDYVFQNDTDLELNFSAIISLCYFDGFNNTSHGSINLIPLPYFHATSPAFNEYTWYTTSKMITIPPYTTETITVSGGTILPVNPSGPTTASGQYFDLNKFNPPIMPAISPAEISLLGNKGKFVGLEGYARDPSTTGTSNLTLRFPIGPKYSSSFTGGTSWVPVPGLPGGYQKFYHTLTKEVCESTTSLGFPSMHLPSKSFNIAGTNYTCSLYTTKNTVVVLLE